MISNMIDKMIDEMLDKFMGPILEANLPTDAGLTLYAKLQNIAHLTADSYLDTVKPICPEFLRNSSDTVSLWRCTCGHAFTTKHEPGTLRGTDVMYCSKCGREYNWLHSEE